MAARNEIITCEQPKLIALVAFLLVLFVKWRGRASFDWRKIERMTKKEISAGGVVYRNIGQDVQILLIVDRYRKLAFAKGRMEEGETIEHAALREIKEETNIVGKIIQPLIINYYQFEHTEFGHVEKETHYFLVEAVSGDLKAQTEEIRGVQWHDAAEAWALHNLNGYENNRVILKMALEILGFLGEESELKV